MTEFYSSIQRFRNPIEMPGGWLFDHAKTLRRINLYTVGKFESGEYDSLGFRKFFYNITKPAIDIARKFIDLDTKDVVLIPEHQDEEFKLWLMQKDLRQWMKTEGFADLLNELKSDFPKYGSIVVKKSKDGLKRVPLENLRFDPSAKSLSDSDFVYEVHLMSAGEIKKMPWNKDAVKILLDSGKKKYEIFECYFKADDGWERKFYADVFRIQDKNGVITHSIEAHINDSNEYLPPQELHSDKIEEFPYREKHWERLPGRWLGFALGEYLTDNQIAVNEDVNLERKALHIKALNIWWTQDEMIGNNLLTDMQSGEVVKTSSAIHAVQKDNTDLTAFASSFNKWLNL